jgi:glyoxylase I family protein
MTPPFDVQRIDHLVLRVRDLARSIRFYGQVLGCHVERQREHLGLAHLRAGASMIDLVDVAGKLGARGWRARRRGRAQRRPPVPAHRAFR